MAGRIPQDILDDILSRINIVELISGYIPLKRAGRNFKALCPFHYEKTPSFMVSPERQIYHCFGCGAGGNAFNFLMQYERLEFLEAVEVLAKKVGVVIPDVSKQDDKTTSLITQLYKVNELAEQFYQNNLESPNCVSAKNYLLNRKINQEMIRLFKLGYALPGQDTLLNYLRTKNVTLSLMEKAGLIFAKEGGGYCDRFRNRIIFPIFDIKSRPIGFGARVLSNEAGLAKYINSPETQIYTKGKNLYGLNFAKDAIREKDCVVVVEGYLDFIIPYQAGFQNIVASLGTALTEEQARLLKRYAQNVIMVYDADDAGQMATLRTLDIFIEQDLNVKVVSLPEGFDPDSFVCRYGIERFREIVDVAENILDYKLKVLKSRYDYQKIEGKAKICAEILPTIDRFKSTVLKSEYIKKISEELKVSEDALLQEIKKLKEDRQYIGLAQVAQDSSSFISPTEKLLIRLMMEEAELIDFIRQHLEPADFQSERTSKIVSIMFDLMEQGKPLELS
ncbi:MAG: DNA primase, partial [Candidatus Omnitrophica bacterium]|nr:DNA primase [Candidatus Omnitrophota bacterium]